jgi:hypothetical protein
MILTYQGTIGKPLAPELVGGEMVPENAYPVELGEFRVIEAAKVQDVSNALPGRLGHFGGIPNTASDCDLLRHPAYVVGDGDRSKSRRRLRFALGLRLLLLRGH